MAQDTVVVSAKVPIQLYNQTQEYFPFYGFTTWFIINSLRELLVQCERDPSMSERVRALVEAMVAENRNGA
jgi:hypothetical protein